MEDLLEKEWAVVGWIHVVQDIDKWLAVMNVVMKLQVV